MTLTQSILFGVVEGLTEFIPISSTAHMLLLQSILGVQSSPALFSYLVMVQLGAIGALLVYFATEFWALIRAFIARPFASEKNRLAWYVIIATIPALIAGALLSDVVQGLFMQPVLEAGIRLLTAAVLLGAAEWRGRKDRGSSAMTWLDSLIVGLFQILAVFPGASRSGAAISGGMLRHFDRVWATRFAFLMSAPVMIAAGAYEALTSLGGGGLQGWLPALMAGIVVAAIVAWLSIGWLLKFVSGHRLYPFAVYCGVVGMVCILSQVL